MSEEINIKDSKAELRSVMLRTRKGMAAEALDALSFVIQQNLVTQPVWQQARSVALYIPTKNEVRTEFLLDAASNDCKTIYLPRVREGRKGFMDFAVCRSPHELMLGAYDIREPDPQYCPSCSFVKPEACPSKSSNTVAPPPDIFIIPGVAYDLTGRRLGFGGGYYDRFLSNPVLRAHSTFIGLAYSFQIVESIPFESWDQPVDALCTDLGYIETGA